MKNLLPICLSFLFSNSLLAQPEINKFSIAAGPSMHGTGDMKGFAVSLVYDHEISRRFSFANGLTTTINYDKHQSWAPQVWQSRLMCFTTAGIQLNSFGQFHIVSKRDQKLSFGLGPMLRFQSTSLPEAYSYVQDPRTYPLPFYVIYSNEKSNTLSPGYTASLTFRSRIASKYFFGIRAAFQNDTNCDAITSISLMMERILPRFKQQN